MIAYMKHAAQRNHLSSLLFDLVDPPLNFISRIDLAQAKLT
jgi:hypothetical protein